MAKPHSTPLPNIQDIDLRLLRVFLSVARNGGFTAAQTELNIGQSTISSCIAKLESRLGVVLCHRGRSGFRLTDSGSKIFAASQDLFQGLEQFRGQVGAVRNELAGTYALGLVDAVADMAQGIVPDILKDFTEAASGVYLDMRLASPRILVSELLDRQLNAIILPVFRPPAGLEVISLEDHDPQSLYCGRGHPFFDRPGKISNDEISRTPFAHRAHMEGWSPYSGHGLNAAASTVDVECQLILVLTGRFISYLPERYAEEWVRRGHLRKINNPAFTYFSKVCLAVLRDDSSNATRELVRCAKARMQARKAKTKQKSATAR